MADAIRVERDGDIAWCALARPPLNLLEPGGIAELHAAFRTLAADASLRAAVVTGGTARAFSAGMDVRVLGGLDAASARPLITALHDAIEAVHRAPFPVIAEIGGACLGAGLELALACDLRIAADDATFGLPEVRVGVPSVIHAALLPPLVGVGHAAELLFLGQTIDAVRALEWGLVTRVVERARLRAAVDTVLATLAACAPAALRLQKSLVMRWRDSDLSSAVRAGIDAFAAAYATHEPREGAAAFLEHRAPRFGARA